MIQQNVDCGLKSRRQEWGRRRGGFRTFQHRSHRIASPGMEADMTRWPRYDVTASSQYWSRKQTKQPARRQSGQDPENRTRCGIILNGFDDHGPTMVLVRGMVNWNEVWVRDRGRARYISPDQIGFFSEWERLLLPLHFLQSNAVIARFTSKLHFGNLLLVFDIFRSLCVVTGALLITSMLPILVQVDKHRTHKSKQKKNLEILCKQHLVDF